MSLLKLRYGVLLGALLPSFAAGQNPPARLPDSVATSSQQSAAQQATAAIGKPVTSDQIATALRQSGLTERQVKDRLRAAGYDTTLANPFFGSGQSPATSPTSGNTPTSTFVAALERIGVSVVPHSDTLVKSAETIGTAGTRPLRRTSVVFGKDIFDRASTAFDPITSGPVDAAYRLGVGDQLQLVVTGQVELAYQLELRRDGTVIVPQVGQISLAGLTLDAARTMLKERMGKSYSGLASGEARLDLSVAKLRSNAVFVIGEVETPGAMQVNALATVFSALARAGGPTDRGSFRNVEVRRAGQVVQRLDLYNYLLRGDASGDIRLEQGDFVFVPLAHRVVAALGEVRRPRTFELRDDEGFDDLLKFAGGLSPTASTERVQIDRILPPDQRSPGKERVKVDVELKGRLDSLARVRLLDGDVVTVFPIGELRRNVVTLRGQVYQPGEYSMKPRMSLGQLIEQAQGLQPWAIAERVKIIRQLERSGRSELISQDVTTPTGQAFELAEFDAVEVLDGRMAFPGGKIFIEGAVNDSTVMRPFVERESVRDAIERSGGLREEAQSVELFRRKVGPAYSDTTSTRFEFAITPDHQLDTKAGQFPLERDDHIYVLSSPGYRSQQFVSIAGQFKYPGRYAISAGDERLRDVVLRAGNVLPGAYPQGFHLIRAGRPVAVDFARAMSADPAQNLPLLGGDSLIIERDPSTVLVTGAVSRASLVRYRPGLSVQDYIELAGGPTEVGNASKAIVDYPSGISRRVTRVALVFHSSPEVVSGATITVPEKPQSTTSSSEMWARVFAASSALASLVLAFVAVRRL